MTQPRARALRSDGIRSRQTILSTAAQLATVEGLDGLSIGRLAEHIGMSKSGLYAHFRSKEELQLATIDTALAVFDAEVIAPTQDLTDPLEQLVALADRFLSYLGRRVFPGGCFFAAAAAEFDTHAGPVRDQIAAVEESWVARLQDLIDRAKQQGKISPAEETPQLTFELHAFLVMANMAFVLHDDSVALERAARAFRTRLGLDAAAYQPGQTLRADAKSLAPVGK